MVIPHWSVDRPRQRLSSAQHRQASAPPAWLTDPCDLSGQVRDYASEPPFVVWSGLSSKFADAGQVIGSMPIY